MPYQPFSLTEGFGLIAGSIREAERAEAVLTAVGIDYCLESEEFTQGILLSPRAGVGIHVIDGQASFARYELGRVGLHSGIIDADA